ncbi:MAG: T9SS type A sorting domain-containing protein, partial [Sphingobacteriaceae bacterium]
IKGSLMLRPVFGRKIEPPVSVKENQLNNENVLVYPNPANDELNVKLSDLKNDVSIALYSINGSLISSQKMIKGEATIQTQNLSNGVYVLMISSPTQGNYHQKVIIQH